MNKLIGVIAAMLSLICMIMAGCSSGSEGNLSNQGETGEPPNGGFAQIPQELAEIPADYYSEADEQGTLVELDYDTYESFSYEEGTQPLQKRAIVYLPYGYSEEENYNIVYLMHGGWSNETTNLGTPSAPSAFKNVIDNAIQSGAFAPLIIVCPTYNNTNENGQDSDNYSLALQLTRNYHNELVNDLIPAVEGRYAGYAESASEQDLIAARDHRAFMGFSMGSVTTWRTFEYCLDYFRYFFPSSGAITPSGDARALSFIFENAEELGINTDGYSLWGGSAGARMAAELGSYGAAEYGGDNIPKPAAVVMQYTGYSGCNPEGEPATFVCVGERDGIASWRTMQRRVEALAAMGVTTEFHVYKGLGHGFGLGTGTAAEGWFGLAVSF